MTNCYRHANQGLGFALLLLLSACNSNGSSGTNVPPLPEGPDFRVVQVSPPASPATQLAVHACAGLENRRNPGSIFVQTDPAVEQSRIDGALVQDEIWLDALDLEPSGTIAARDFLDECIAVAAGCVRYAYDEQQAILPAILTAAAAQGAVPLADESPVQCQDPVWDATTELADKNTPLLATQYVYENHLAQTSGLAMLNPGYDRFADELSNPSLIEDMPVALIDLVFSRKLFVTFLVNGCIEDHPERALLTDIVNDSDWERPIGVYGYNDSWLVAGGYLYEAHTDCLDTGNMGAIPTRTTNLSFFDTRRDPIDSSDLLPKNKPETITYDPEKTYVAFVVGDGDNIRYIMSTRKLWLEQRLERCRDAKPKCPPLNWSISPHLPDLAPDVLRWYYDAAAQTGSDYFVLPPSGYLYAYPSMLNDENEAAFAARTNAAAELLGTRSVVHWEWFESWDDSTANFLPRYAQPGSQIQGIFAINVPYLAEAFPDWPEDKMNEVLGDDQAVLFRPQSWRGVNDRDSYFLNPQRMAGKLADFPEGTVTWVYMTSDGGLSLDNSYFELLDYLPDDVQIVSADAAAQLAVAASHN